jgi:hypothetical protein
MPKLRRKWCAPRPVTSMTFALCNVVVVAPRQRSGFRLLIRLHQEILPNIVTSLASADFRVTVARRIPRAETASQHGALQVRGDGLAQLYELMARLGDRVGSKLVSFVVGF